MIAAYARMEHDLSSVGLPRRASETAPEYLRRVLIHFEVSRDASARLTDLFERAKFGGGSVEADAKDDAIACLERVAAEVGEQERGEGGGTLALGALGVAPIVVAWVSPADLRAAIHVVVPILARVSRSGRSPSRCSRNRRPPLGLHAPSSGPEGQPAELRRIEAGLAVSPGVRDADPPSPRPVLREIAGTGSASGAGSTSTAIPPGLARRSATRRGASYDLTGQRRPTAFRRGSAWMGSLASWNAWSRSGVTKSSTYEELAQVTEAIVAELERAVIGKREVLELMLMAFLAAGHVLIDDYPGLAKTLIARSFATITGLEFGRIQFTPDLLPSDITGSSIYDQRAGDFEFGRAPSSRTSCSRMRSTERPPRRRPRCSRRCRSGR